MKVTMNKKTLDVTKIEEDQLEKINIMPELARILAREFLKDLERRGECEMCGTYGEKL